jgi:hypothetical protein
VLRDDVDFRLLGPILFTLASASVADAGSILVNPVVATNGAITVQADTVRFAGAISSLRLSGFEYVNTADHGRELQSAVSFDGLGECWNPTEAGSRADGNGPISSSVFVGGTIASKSKFSTVASMANWLAPGETAGCPAGASNPTVLSPNALAKTITIGAAGRSNVVRHDVTFEVRELHSSGVFEALTLYTSPSLDTVWTYDPRTRTLAKIPFPQAEQGMPVILSTADGRFASGVWSPGLPQPGFAGSGYGAFYFPGDTAKWNCVYRMNDVPEGDYSFTVYSFFGTVADVTKSMDAVYARAR